MAIKMDPRISVLAHALQRSLIRSGHLDIAEDCSKLLADLEVRQKSEGVDGRSLSWSPERKAKLGAKIQEAFEKRRKERGLENNFYAYQYADVQPKLIVGLDAMVKDSGLVIGTIRSKLSQNKDGFSVSDKVTKTRIFYARASDQDAIDRLLRQEYIRVSDGHVGEGSGTYVLPSKKNKRF